MKIIVFSFIFVVTFSSFAFSESRIYRNDDLDKYSYPHTELPPEAKLPEEKPKIEEKKLYKKQIILRNFPQYHWEGEDRIYGGPPFGWASACRDYCKEISENIDSYLNSGWLIVSSRSIESTESPFYNNGYCRCVGTEYVLEGYFER